MRQELIEQFGCSTDYPILTFSGQYRFLSNFWICPVVYDGIQFQSSEHAYMYQKTEDEEYRQRIRFAPTPAKAKSEGRNAPLRADWEEVKLEIMHAVVYAKFSQNPNLKALLLSTGDRYLEEGNTWNDTVWGVCNGVGTNFLGAVLMLVRGQLKGTI